MTARTLEPPAADYNAINKLTADIKKAALMLTDKEARYLVDGYYALQGYRVATWNQITALEKSSEPNAVLGWFFGNAEMLEGQMKRALKAYAGSKVVGRWSQSIVGIGEVISAGLLAHIDINQAPTAGHIWRFAGLDPTNRWLGRDGSSELIDRLVEANAALVPKKGEAVPFEFIQLVAKEMNRDAMRLANLVDEEKGYVTMASLTSGIARRPWNAALKTLCWKIGESFLKVHNNPKDFYGKLYATRKAWETEKNLNKDYKDQAEEKLKKFKISKSTDAYKAYAQGMLPDGRIHERAKRYAVKIFLSHWHAVAFESTFNKPSPIPYIIAYDPKHTHTIEVPNWPMVEE
jgi:hypothetical protein